MACEVSGVPVTHRVGPYGIAINPASNLDYLVMYQPDSGNTSGINYQWDYFANARSYSNKSRGFSTNITGASSATIVASPTFAGANSISFTKASTDPMVLLMQLNNNGPLRVGCSSVWIRLDTATAGLPDVFGVYDSAGARIFKVYMSTAGAFFAEGNTSNVITGSSLSIGTSTWYNLQIAWDTVNSTASFRCYDTSGNIVCSLVTSPITATNPVSTVRLGSNFSSEAYTGYFDNHVAWRSNTHQKFIRVTDLDTPRLPDTFRSTPSALLSFTSAQTRKAKKVLANALLSFTSAQTRKAKRATTATLSFTSAQTRKAKRTVNGTVSFTSAQTRKMKKSVTATLSFTSAQTRKAKKILTASWSSSGALTTRTAIRKTLGGALSFTSAQARKAKKPVSATLSFSGANIRRVRKFTAAAGSFSGSLTKRVRKTLTASLGFSGNHSTNTITGGGGGTQTGLPWIQRWRRKRQS